MTCFTVAMEVETEEQREFGTWILLAGIQQDCHGTDYQQEKNTKTGELRKAAAVKPNIPANPMYAKIIVTSKGYEAALGIISENEKQAQKLQAVIDRGPTYESLVFFQVGSWE